MKLIDYIKGPRRGAQANALERQAMCDPFLSDAIEGYDTVYGNHSDKLKEVSDKILRRSKRRRKNKLPKRTISPGHIEPAKEEQYGSYVDGLIEVTDTAGSGMFTDDNYDISDPGSNNPGLRKKRRILTLVGVAGLSIMIIAGGIYMFYDDECSSDGVLVATEVPIDETEESMEPPVLLEEQDEDMMAAESIVVEKGEEKSDRRQNETAATEGGKTKVEIKSPANDGLATEVSVSSDRGIGTSEPAAINDRTAVQHDLAKKAADGDVELIVNEEFQSFFDANKKIHTDSFGDKIIGEALVEFRVNEKGVPSAIRVISGISAETNSEIIGMLINGPLWAPTGGKRVRIIIKYD